MQDARYKFGVVHIVKNEWFQVCKQQGPASI